MRSAWIYFLLSLTIMVIGLVLVLIFIPMYMVPNAKRVNTVNTLCVIVEIRYSGVRTRGSHGLEKGPIIRSHSPSSVDDCIQVVVSHGLGNGSSGYLYKEEQRSNPSHVSPLNSHPLLRTPFC